MSEEENPFAARVAQIRATSEAEREKKKAEKARAKLSAFCGQPYDARGDVWQCWMPKGHPLDCETLNVRRHRIAVAHVEIAEREFAAWYETLLDAQEMGVLLSESDEAFEAWQAQIKKSLGLSVDAESSPTIPVLVEDQKFGRPPGITRRSGW